MRARLIGPCLAAAAFISTPLAEAATAWRATGIEAPRQVKARFDGWSAAAVDARYVRDARAPRRAETLFQRYPLKLTVRRDGKVMALWRLRSRGAYELVSSAPAAEEYRVRFSCDAAADAWRLTVNGRTDLAPAYGKCLGTAWGKLFVGGATLANEPVNGRLDLTLSGEAAPAGRHRRSPEPVSYSRHRQRQGTPAPAPVPAPSPSPSSASSGAAIIDADHSSGDFSQWPNSGMVMGGKNPWSQQVVEWDGDQVGRFEVREGESGPNRKVRSEVSDTTVRKNTEWWYSWRTQIPQEWQDNDSTWYIVSQFHQAPPPWRNGDWGPPPLKFGYSGGRWTIGQWFYDEDHPKSPLYKAVGGKGVWVNWRVHAVWRGDDEGLLQIWRDGALVVDRRGKNINGDSGMATFFKQGIYRGYGDPNTQVILHDDYRRSPTRDGVN